MTGAAMTDAVMTDAVMTDAVMTDAVMTGAPQARRGVRLRMDLSACPAHQPKGPSPA
jgi:hypothetical protein